MKYPNRSEYEKAWREKNKEKYLKTKKAYYLKNKEYCCTKARERYSNVVQPDRKTNREKYKEIDRLWAQKRRAKFRELFIQIKKEMGNKCSKCGFDEYPQILHFHHLRNKRANVSEMKSLKKIREEVTKCVLLCPNCHMILTFITEKKPLCTTLSDGSCD
jgi:hypothetical protein